MRAREHKLKPCIVIDDAVTKRFIQLCGGFSKPLMVDMPDLALKPNVVSHPHAVELFGGEPRLVFEEVGLFSYTKEVPTVDEAVELVMLALNLCLCLPEFAELNLSEFCQGKEILS